MTTLSYSFETSLSLSSNIICLLDLISILTDILSDLKKSEFTETTLKNINNIYKLETKFEFFVILEKEEISKLDIVPVPRQTLLDYYVRTLLDVYPIVHQVGPKVKDIPSSADEGSILLSEQLELQCIDFITSLAESSTIIVLVKVCRILISQINSASDKSCNLSSLSRILSLINTINKKLEIETEKVSGIPYDTLRKKLLAMFSIVISKIFDRPYMFGLLGEHSE